MEQTIISNLEKEIDELRYTLHQKEEELARIKQDFLSGQNTVVKDEKRNNGECTYGKLPKWAIVRYSRQILLSDIGVSGQCRLRSARVLVAGAGALACPALVYLAGAGVGEIGIVDYDTVEVTNIHRQFLHTERDEHKSKAHSAAQKLRSINSTIKVNAYNEQITSKNAKQIASNYDIVLDCTDNVPTRYLLNDLCVMLKIPLISGSALKMEGQLTIYGYRAENNDKEKESSYRGPCYRCLFPVPPPAETVGSCSANGVAGPVPGAIGALQALETIKYIVGHTHGQILVGRMLIFDGQDITFRTVKLRPRNAKCEICSDNPTITELIDYELFCKSDAKEKDLDLKILSENQRITAVQLSKYLSNESSKQRHLLVDVRNECEFQMCNIYGSVNYPIDKLYDDKMKDLLKKTKEYDYGEIGIVDYDTVEVTNIHRQFLHTERDEHKSKAHSAAQKLRSINSTIKVNAYNEQITSKNAKQIASNYDIVLDCTDNVPTRYLLNDLCVMLKIPLISGSALKMEGQLTIYGYRAENNDKEMESSYRGPCYRCLFPVPPPAETVGSCSANGVAGPVPGAIGALQALETIKYIVGHTHGQILVGRMLIFDGQDITFRTVKLRPRNPKCEICSDNPTITELIDYELFCKSDAKEKDLDLKILSENQRITAVQLSKYLSNESLKQRHLLVDVRNKCEFQMCNIDGSVNYPIDKLYDDKMEDLLKKTKEYDYVTFICRRGNDSQIVCEKLLNEVENDQKYKIKDLIGGLHSWAKTVDDNFPIY